MIFIHFSTSKKIKIVIESTPRLSGYSLTADIVFLRKNFILKPHQIPGQLLTFDAENIIPR